MEWLQMSSHHESPLKTPCMYINSTIKECLIRLEVVLMLPIISLNPFKYDVELRQCK